MTASTKTKLLDKLAELNKLFNECITNEVLKNEILHKRNQEVSKSLQNMEK